MNPSDSTSRCDVLVADDAGGSRELLTGLVRGIAGDLDVRQARDGDEAIAMWSSLRPRITLLDIDMPGTDGLSALARIRATDGDAFVAVVSASGDVRQIGRAMALGAAAYVVKPYRPRRIVEVLRRYQELSGQALHA